MENVSVTWKRVLVLCVLYVSRCVSVCGILNIAVCGFCYVYELCVKKFLELLCFNRGVSASTIKEILVTQERLWAKMRQKLRTDFKDDLQRKFYIQPRKLY